MAITPTTVQLQIDNESLLRLEYGDTWDKKYRDKGQAIWTFQRRNLSTACVVVSRLHGIDFDSASTFMFHLANNAGECKPIVEAVNSQLELAIIKPDKFIKGLHKFFQELTKPIKKDKQYALYSPYQAQWWPVPLAHKFPVSALKGALHHRRRTLPANGAVIQFGSRQMLREVKLKETCRDNEIICVYKIKTPDGDVSGYYNTNSEWFYSMLDGSDYMDLHDQITHLILWLYTSLVCDVPDLLPTDDSFRRSFITREGVPTDLKFLTLGGKPRNYLKKDDGEDSTLNIFDKSKYDASSKSINGFVRKLPAGQKASERSLKIAESYGFELHEDETYVMPFVRRQWLKKKTEE